MDALTIRAAEEAAEALAALFPDLSDIEAIALASPTASGGFRASPWRPGQGVGLKVSHFAPVTLPWDWYRYPLGTSHVGAPWFERKQENVMRILGVVLDDVHEKCRPFPEALPPAMIVETKEGSEQHLHLFTEAMTLDDRHLLSDFLKAGGWNDPKGGDNVVRLGRLPGSLKPQAPDRPPARLLHLDPAARHDPLDVLTVLAASLGPKKLARVGGPREAGPLPIEDAARACEVDPFFALLHRRGLILGPPERGWWPTKCPLADEHRDEGYPKDTAYHPAANGQGRFCCYRSGGHVTAEAKRHGFTSATSYFRNFVREDLTLRARGRMLIEKDKSQ